jgi:hypothetical protein
MRRVGVVESVFTSCAVHDVNDDVPLQTIRHPFVCSKLQTLAIKASFTQTAQPTLQKTIRRRNAAYRSAYIKIESCIEIHACMHINNLKIGDNAVLGSPSAIENMHAFKFMQHYTHACINLTHHSCSTQPKNNLSQGRRAYIKDTRASPLHAIKGVIKISGVSLA